MMNSSLHQHVLVLLVGRNERGIALKEVLERSGYQVFISTTLYDGLQLIGQEMPHLIIAESSLNDGHAGTLYDKLQQHETLKKAPILVHIMKKTRSDLEAVAQRKFAGFIIGTMDLQVLVGKLQEIIDHHCPVSPYFVATEQLKINEGLTISMDATVIGKSNEMLISHSNVDLDPQANILCTPQENQLGPAVFRLPRNLQNEQQTFNLFPINRIIGKGRLWVERLPTIALGESLEAAEKYPPCHVLYYDTNEARYQQFQHILQGYGIHLIYASSLQKSLQILRQRYDELACVYLNELLQDAAGIEWKNETAKLSPTQKPPIVIGTTSLHMRSTPELSYLKKPFGLGTFVETLRATILRGQHLKQALEGRSQQGIAVKYRAPAKVIGLDEMGGILQVAFPMLAGCRLSIDHPFFTEAWAGHNSVVVIAASKIEEASERWHVRFQAVAKGVSKTKYWSRVEMALKKMAENDTLKR